jgi:hypothetical protein
MLDLVCYEKLAELLSDVSPEDRGFIGGLEQPHDDSSAIQEALAVLNGILGDSLATAL